MQIIRGKQPGALKVVVYGPEGIGKSTFASQFPDPLFIDTEDSTRYMDVARTPKPTSWTLLLSQVKEVQRDPSLCRTLVLDTADWAERLCIKHICNTRLINGEAAKGIEDYGYGSGYTYVHEAFGRLLNELSIVVEQGIHVVITAHSIVDKFEQPSEIGSYDRWRMKLINSKKCSIVSLTKEWADMVLFVNYETFVVNVDGKGSQKGTNKAQGGRRVMYTTHSLYWDAKNRFDLAAKLPFQYSEIEGIIEGALASRVRPDSEKKAVSPVAEQPSMNSGKALAVKEEKAESTQKTLPKTKQKVDYSDDFAPAIPDCVPQDLKDLMLAHNVTVPELEMYVMNEGYFPTETPIENFPTSPKNFYQFLVSIWYDEEDGVLDSIKKEREKIPF